MWHPVLTISHIEGALEWANSDFMQASTSKPTIGILMGAKAKSIK
jgi:hypothetical protein